MISLKDRFCAQAMTPLQRIPPEGGRSNVLVLLAMETWPWRKRGLSAVLRSSCFLAAPCVFVSALCRCVLSEVNPADPAAGSVWSRVCVWAIWATHRFASSRPADKRHQVDATSQRSGTRCHLTSRATFKVQVPRGRCVTAENVATAATGVLAEETQRYA